MFELSDTLYYLKKSTNKHVSREDNLIILNKNIMTLSKHIQKILTEEVIQLWLIKISSIDWPLATSGVMRLLKMFIRELVNADADRFLLYSCRFFTSIY